MSSFISKANQPLIGRIHDLKVYRYDTVSRSLYITFFRIDIDSLHRVFASEINTFIPKTDIGTIRGYFRKFLWYLYYLFRQS